MVAVLRSPISNYRPDSDRPQTASLELSDPSGGTLECGRADCARSQLVETRDHWLGLMSTRVIPASARIPRSRFRDQPNDAAGRKLRLVAGRSQLGAYPTIGLARAASYKERHGPGRLPGSEHPMTDGTGQVVTAKIESSLPIAEG
jgi:hypothetical protein